MPGISIDANGKITAQGKVVENILVDGKKFFSDDPTIPTRILPADAIKTVEIYDESSKKADFTGIDDPNKEKTINLILKEERKKGWFGEAYAGAGGSKQSDKRYNTSLNMNRFAPNRQSSIVGDLGNTGTGQNGFQQTQSLGINANRTLRDLTQLNGNVNGIDNRQDGQQITSRQVLLPTGNLNSSEKSAQNQRNQGLNANFGVNNNPSARTILNFSGNGQLNQGSATAQSSNKTLNNVGNALNAAQTRNRNTSLGQAGNMDFLYGRRSKNDLYNGTVAVKAGLRMDENEQQVFAENSFFGADGSLARLDTIFQKAKQDNTATQAALSASLGAKIGKDRILQSDYSFSFFENKANLSTFDLNQGNERLNDSLSNTFFNRSIQHRIGLKTQIKNRKWLHNIGLDAQIAKLSGGNGTAGSALKRSFWRVLPSLNSSRNFGKTTSFNLDYRTDLTTPDVAQLQAVPDRRDPLNIREGNPDLKPEFGHRFIAGFNRYHPESFRSIFGNINVDYLQNRIIETISVTPSFVRRYRPQNMQGEVRVGGNISVGIPINKWKSNFNFGVNANFSRGQAYLNDRQNRMQNETYSQYLSWDFSPRDWFNQNISLNIVQNKLQYSVDKTLNQLYFDQTYNISHTLILPKKWNFRSDFSLNISQGRADGFNLLVPVWNIAIAKRILSGDRLSISLEVNDLLNRKTNLVRTTNLNFVQDVQSNILSRYFFLSGRYTIMAN